MPEPARTAPLNSDAASLQRRDTKLLRILAMSRYAVGVAVVGTFFAATALLAELELKLLEVVLSTLGVAFLGQVVTWDWQRDLLGFGMATALVIGSLAYAVSRVAPRQEPSALLSRSDHD